MTDRAAMTLDEVSEYLAKHNLEAIIADSVNDAVEARSADPLEHIAVYLRGKNKPALRLVEPHHHFLAPELPHHKFLADHGAPAYTPEDYAKDVGAAPVTKSVHVEAIPNDGLAEAPRHGQRNVHDRALHFLTPGVIVFRHIGLQARAQLRRDRLQGLQRINDVEAGGIGVRKLHDE